MTAAGDDGEFKVVATNVIPQVSQVLCYDETIPHISSEHVEFQNFIPTLEHAIHDTIISPTHVVQSNTAIHSTSFKYCSTDHRRGNNHLVVAVKVVEGTSALLKTAYFTSGVSGDRVFEKDGGNGGD